MAEKVIAKEALERKGTSASDESSGEEKEAELPFLPSNDDAVKDAEVEGIPSPKRKGKSRWVSPWRFTHTNLSFFT